MSNLLTMSFRTSYAVGSSASYLTLPCCQFTFSEIELATENFDEMLVIGRGGFGKVYRGTVSYGESHLDVAVKRLDPDSSQGAEEFRAEVEMLSNIRHCHLVSLVGYCSDKQEMILVYEYMPNGTLADRLHKRRAPVLSWTRRLKICIGAARGLDYLHTSTGIKHGVIHRDVKSSNILLDDNWAAKISDFGLSKIGPINQPSTYVNTLVRGTFGYLDPDYFQTGRLTRKSDVYAFGVVLLEVLCEKKAGSIDEEECGLVSWAQDSFKEGRLKQIVDYKLRDRIFPKCLKKFALLADQCLHSRPKQRPTMAEVVASLESILALQEKADNTMPFKLFGRGVQTPRITYNPSSVGGTSLKSLDIFLYNLGGEDRIVHRFDFNTLLNATEQFSEANEFSSDGYLSMYKGRLQNGQDILITIYDDVDLYERCMKEASLLVRLEHENVIQLLGYCIEGIKVYLIYDFAVNATLGDLIYDLLDWNKRYKIILGVARVLVYLHNHAPIQIIHGNVRPYNILLDERFDPTLSGFYSAMAVDETDDIHVDQTFRFLYPTPYHIREHYYKAPEYFDQRRPSTKADVFSFGLVVLETVTGQRIWDLSREELDLIHYARRNLLEGTVSNIIDPRIDVDANSITKFVEIGLLCVQRDPNHRPTMEEVVGMLVGTVSLTISVSEMRSRVNEDTEFNEDEDYDTGAVEAFISELDPR